MCGILFYNSQQPISLSRYREINNEFMKMIARGPDNSKVIRKDQCVIGFHRLAIMDISSRGDQPILGNSKETQMTICNGEIYNHQQLSKDFSISLKTESDCEIIMKLYQKVGPRQLCNYLDGVFAYVILDEERDEIIVGRDPFGVRSLYYGCQTNGDICFSSELKGLHNLCEPSTIQMFPPGQTLIYNRNTLEKEWFSYYQFQWSPYSNFQIEGYQHLFRNVRSLLINAVKKRFMAHREIGCLLSGGLDSSLVASIVARYQRELNNTQIHTFSIGLKGATDLQYAKMVANHIGSIHHEVIVTEQQMLEAIPRVIEQIESYDTTTVRASTPMVLLCEYIKANTSVTVLYSGEGADEASGSYLYFQNAPSLDEFQKESSRLLEDLQYFDVLRSDKSVSGCGLEVRVPFLDKEFIEYYMRIPPEYKDSKHQMEKQVLRKAFSDNWLPEKVLWRRKEAFSDGCSSQERSWYTVIQEYVQTKLINVSEETASNYWEHNPPMIKESIYYRQLFDSFYPQCDHTIPYYWLPKWSGDVTDPSARVLTNYDTSSTQS